MREDFKVRTSSKRESLQREQEILPGRFSTALWEPKLCPVPFPQFSPRLVGEMLASREKSANCSLFAALDAATACWFVGLLFFSKRKLSLLRASDPASRNLDEVVARHISVLTFYIWSRPVRKIFTH